MWNRRPSVSQSKTEIVMETEAHRLVQQTNSAGAVLILERKCADAMGASAWMILGRWALKSYDPTPEHIALALLVDQLARERR
jgi:hypothetical protein